MSTSLSQTQGHPSSPLGCPQVWPALASHPGRAGAAAQTAPFPAPPRQLCGGGGEAGVAPFCPGGSLDLAHTLLLHLVGGTRCKTDLGRRGNAEFCLNAVCSDDLEILPLNNEGGGEMVFGS